MTKTQRSNAARKANATRAARRELRKNNSATYFALIDLAHNKPLYISTKRAAAIKANLNRPGAFRDLVLAANLATCND